MTPTTETWLPVGGFEGRYEVSDLGRVRSLPRVVTDTIGRRQPIAGRMMKLQRNKYGRWVVPLSNSPQEARLRQVASLVLEAFIGPRPDGMECCHNNGKCDDDRLENLRWDTKSGNMLDKIQHGTHHQVNKTHCNRGHALAAPNLCGGRSRIGKRQCRACHRALVDSYRNPAIDVQARADELYTRFVGERISVG